MNDAKGSMAMTSAERLFREGVALHRAGDLANAERLYREVIVSRPQTGVAWENLVLILKAQGRAQELPDAYAGLVEAQPENAMAAFNLATSLLAVGRYAEGWSYFERRPPRANATAHAASFPEWKGEPLEDRSILIWGEQGLGDQIQFARFIPELRARGSRRIVVACAPSLTRLFETLPVDAILSNHGRMEVERCDYWALSMSLPHQLGITLANLPSAPYLPAEPLPDGGPELGARLNVGTVWRGGDLFIRNAARSLQSPDAMRELEAPGINFIDLQEPRGDMADSANILAGLDLMITVDTSWAHLAGAMGRPCWVLLARPHLCWRWGVEGQETPWYPSLRLYRQHEPGRWDAVLAEVARDLKALANRRS